MRGELGGGGVVGWGGGVVGGGGGVVWVVAVCGGGDGYWFGLWGWGRER